METDHVVVFMWLCKEWGLPAPTREYRFAPPRRWRFDLAWPDRKVAVEIEGVFYRGGRKSRHQTGTGYAADLDKYNVATAEGWRLYRFTPKQSRSLTNIEMLAKELR